MPRPKVFFCHRVPRLVYSKKSLEVRYRAPQPCPYYEHQTQKGATFYPYVEHTIKMWFQCNCSYTGLPRCAWRAVSHLQYPQSVGHSSTPVAHCLVQRRGLKRTRYCRIVSLKKRNHCYGGRGKGGLCATTGFEALLRVILCVTERNV